MYLTLKNHFYMQLMSCKGKLITLINKTALCHERNLKQYREHSGFRTTKTHTQLVGEYKLVQPHSRQEYKLVNHFGKQLDNIQLKIYTPFNVENSFRYNLEEKTLAYIYKNIYKFVTAKIQERCAHPPKEEGSQRK